MALDAIGWEGLNFVVVYLNNSFEEGITYWKANDALTLVITYKNNFLFIIYESLTINLFLKCF
jgi:hypothetical protein